jgi:cytochrome b involved in lipid metabolism
MSIKYILLLGALVVSIGGGAYFMFSSDADRAATEGDIAQVEEKKDAFPPMGENETVSEDSPLIMTDDSDQTGPDGDADDMTKTEPVKTEPVAPKPATPTTAPKPTTPVVTTPTPTPPPTPAPKPSGYTMADVAQHTSKTSCWTAINGSVYDITSYIPRHPGGERNTLKLCGVDGTATFEGQHGGESKPESILASLRIGALID